MQPRIYLTGFMGSGKPTYGRKIARMMGYSFIDLDEYIIQEAGKSIPDIFRDHGEKHFRELEKKALFEIGNKNKVVISTGGGTPCYNNNMEFIKNNGLVIYLKLSPEALYSRLINSVTERPLLKGKTESELKIYIEEKLLEREPFYNQAHMIIDGFINVDERLVNAIQRK